jgi:hypothetical protein
MGLGVGRSCSARCGRLARAGAAEVHARQPGRVTRADVEAAFFGHLTPARIPGRLPTALHDAAGNRPARLVGGLQDQQPARPVEDESARGHRDGREADGIQNGLVRPETVVRTATAAAPEPSNTTCSTRPSSHRNG